MKTFVKILNDDRTNDKKFTLMVKPEDTINIIKLKIEAKQGVLEEEQALFFMDEQLRDEESLSFYNITDGSFLYLKISPNPIEVDALTKMCLMSDYIDKILDQKLETVNLEHVNLLQPVQDTTGEYDNSVRPLYCVCFRDSTLDEKHKKETEELYPKQRAGKAKGKATSKARKDFDLRNPKRWMAAIFPTEIEASDWIEEKKMASSDTENQEVDIPIKKFEFDTLIFHAQHIKSLLITRDLVPNNAIVGRRIGGTAKTILNIECTMKNVNVRTVTVNEQKDDEVTVTYTRMHYLFWVGFTNGSNTKTLCNSFCLSDVIINGILSEFEVPVNRQKNDLEIRGNLLSEGPQQRLAMITTLDRMAGRIFHAFKEYEPLDMSIETNIIQMKSLLTTFLDVIDSQYKTNIEKNLKKILFEEKRDFIEYRLAYRKSKISADEVPAAKVAADEADEILLGNGLTYDPQNPARDCIGKFSELAVMGDMNKLPVGYEFVSPITAKRKIVLSAWMKYIIHGQFDGCFDVGGGKVSIKLTAMYFWYRCQLGEPFKDVCTAMLPYNLLASGLAIIHPKRKGSGLPYAFSFKGKIQTLSEVQQTKNLRNSRKRSRAVMNEGQNEGQSDICITSSSTSHKSEDDGTTI